MNRDAEAWPGQPWDDITEEDNESVLIIRHITDECDRHHLDPQEAGCSNPGCQCWCHG